MKNVSTILDALHDTKNEKMGLKNSGKTFQTWKKNKKVKSFSFYPEITNINERCLKFAISLVDR